MLTDADRLDPPSAAFKSRLGLRRIRLAAGYSWAGLRAACRHEAAFRQELAVGVPLLAVAAWLAPGRWQLLALASSVLLVWIVELLNSALEALADAVSTEVHPLIMRAKDMASAAVMLSIAVALLVWTVVLWPR